mgnify:CR=1 FL=1
MTTRLELLTDEQLHSLAAKTLTELRNRDEPAVTGIINASNLREFLIEAFKQVVSTDSLAPESKE